MDLPSYVFIITAFHLRLWRIDAFANGQEVLVIRPTNNTVIPGGKTSFTCSYNRKIENLNGFHMLWEHNNNLIAVSKRKWVADPHLSVTFKTSNTTAETVLKISELTTNNRGEYKCVVVDKTLYHETTASLKVNEGVVTISAMKGLRLNLSCVNARHVSSNVFYIWYVGTRILFFNQTRIAANQRISIIQNGQVLQIENLSTRDSGTYKCKIGHIDIKTFNLNIYEMTTNPPTTTKKSVSPSGKTEKWKVWAGIAGAVVLLVIIIAVVIACCWRKNK